MPQECSARLATAGHTIWRQHMAKVDDVAQGLEGGVFAGVLGAAGYSGWRL